MGDAHTGPRGRILHADSYVAMRLMAPESVDAIVCDPPYMTRVFKNGFDEPETSAAGDVRFWTLALRVLKPGGHLLAFGSARTYHRIAVAVEDAGFEIRGSLSWIYGNGHPKSHNISKQIDKMAGVEQTVVGRRRVINSKETLLGFSGLHWKHPEDGSNPMKDIDITEATTDEAKYWDGWNAAIKQAHDPVIYARKPFRGTLAANVLEHGTSALNVDGCRVDRGGGKATWPVDVLLNHDRECVNGMCVPACPVSEIKKQTAGGKQHQLFPAFAGPEFFYSGKCTRQEKEAGCGLKHPHPMVKPISVMRWLCRLVTPPGGLVLDPFSGSGTTVIAANLEGFRAVGVERQAEYIQAARARVAWWAEEADDKMRERTRPLTDTTGERGANG